MIACRSLLIRNDYIYIYMYMYIYSNSCMVSEWVYMSCMVLAALMLMIIPKALCMGTEVLGSKPPQISLFDES